MKEEEILDILKDWNFWLKEIDTGIQRESYPRNSTRKPRTLVLG
jgi:hypothetical protein